MDIQDGLLAELARDELADVTRLTDVIDALAARMRPTSRHRTGPAHYADCMQAAFDELVAAANSPN